jgi:hypothetical protein
MLYSAAAAILGPSLLLQLRSMSEIKYINELLQIVSAKSAYILVYDISKIS